jgi:hypothetical protein
MATPDLGCRGVWYPMAHRVVAATLFAAFSRPASRTSQQAARGPADGVLPLIYQGMLGRHPASFYDRTQSTSGGL